MHRSVIVILLPLLVLFGTSSDVMSAEVYRWLGPQNNVQFGDRPPPNARQLESLDIDVEQRMNPDVDTAGRLQRQQRLIEELERARIERERARAAAAQAARRAVSLCAQYRDRVRLLADDGVNWIKGRNADGSNSYYSDAEVSRMRAQAARGVSVYCR